MKRSKTSHSTIFIVTLVILLSFFLYLSFGQKTEHGQQLYQHYCASCHMEDGTGLRGLIPPLANADYLRKYPSNISCIIYRGMSTPVVVNGTTYNRPMPGNLELSFVDITNLVNYINKKWGDQNTFSLEEIKYQLDNCSQQ